MYSVQPLVSQEMCCYLRRILKFLEEQKKNTGLAYWACRPCTVYAQGINHRLREMEKRLDSVEEANKKNDNNITQVKKKVKKLKGRWRIE